MRWAKGANSATNLSAGTGQMRPSARRVGRCWTLVRAVPRNNAIGRSWHGPRATASATANPTQQKAIRYSVSKRTASRRPYKQDLLHYVHADPRNPFGHRQRRRKGRTTDDADSADERRVIRGSAGSPLAAARTRSKAPTTEGRPTLSSFFVFRSSLGCGHECGSWSTMRVQEEMYEYGKEGKMRMEM